MQQEIFFKNLSQEPDTTALLEQQETARDWPQWKTSDGIIYAEWFRELGELRRYRTTDGDETNDKTWPINTLEAAREKLREMGYEFTTCEHTNYPVYRPGYEAAALDLQPRAEVIRGVYELSIGTSHRDTVSGFAAEVWENPETPSEWPSWENRYGETIVEARGGSYRVGANEELELVDDTIETALTGGASVVREYLASAGILVHYNEEPVTPEDWMDTEVLISWSVSGTSMVMINNSFAEQYFSENPDSSKEGMIEAYMENFDTGDIDIDSDLDPESIEIGDWDEQ